MLDQNTALIVVDVQNSFVDGSLPVPEAPRVIEETNKLVRLAADAGAPVVYTMDWHPKDSAEHFRKWPMHCVAGSYGAELHQDLLIGSPAIMVRKGTHRHEDGYSGFSNHRHGEKVATALGSWLERLGVDAVVVAGLALDYCVRATALDAVEFGLEAYLATEATAAVNLNPGDGERALMDLARGGVVLK